MTALAELKSPYFEHFERLIAKMQRQPQKVLQLESASFAAFACSVCGECCTLPWAIRVSKSYYERWNEVFSGDPRFDSPFVLESSRHPSSWASIRRKENSSECIFLQADQSCYIHAHYGPEALSEVCREYPRARKHMGHQYQAAYLLSSCRDVPATLVEHPQIYYRLSEPESLALAARAGQPYPGRFQSYLWLGLSLDVLNAEQPTTLLERWRELVLAWEWLDALGLEQVDLQHLGQVYHELMARLPFAGLHPTSPERVQQAWQWGSSLLRLHPGCQNWLRTRPWERPTWEPLNAETRRLLDRYMQAYACNRLLALPYADNFIADLDLWQQCFLLSLQILALQELFLYYRSQTPQEPVETQLGRALNFVGVRLEQTTSLDSFLHLSELDSSQCFEAMLTASALNFAQEQPL